MYNVIINHARRNPLTIKPFENYRNRIVHQLGKYVVTMNNPLSLQPTNSIKKNKTKPNGFITNCKEFSEEIKSVNMNFNFPSSEGTRYREHTFENLKEEKEESIHRDNKRKYKEKEDEEDKLKILLNKRIEKKRKKKNIIEITKEAKEEIKKRILNFHQEQEKNKDHVLKLFFITKGCNGLTHALKFVHKNTIDKDDEIIYDDNEDNKATTHSRNILLVVDSKCVLYVINTVLDYFKDDLSEKFIFTNPNITSICPCGTSFHFSKKN